MERWTREFPLEVEPSVRMNYFIDGPRSLAWSEQVREWARGVADLGTPVPTDLVLLERGAPRAPYLTQIGGAPYIDEGDWPLTTVGVPMTFVCQVCFVDSLDLFDQELPGDVLLCFVDPDVPVEVAESDDVALIWQRIGLVDPSAAVPATTPCYAGVLLRSEEFPESLDVFYELGFQNSADLSRRPVSRIGGVAGFPQGESDNECLALLAAITRVAPPMGKWPFLNVEGPLGKAERKAGRVPLGNLYFFMGTNGEVVFETQIT